MPDDILTRIDAATGCLSCGGPLGSSPSDDFCDQDCMAIWHESRVIPLPETPAEESARQFLEWLGRMVREISRVYHEVIKPQLVAAFQQLTEAFRRFCLAMGWEPAPAVPDDREAVMARALQARRTRNTGPPTRERPPRTIRRL